MQEEVGKSVQGGNLKRGARGLARLERGKKQWKKPGGRCEMMGLSPMTRRQIRSHGCWTLKGYEWP